MRNKAIDAFRGIIMIIMALDHASYFLIKQHFYEGYDYIYTEHTLLTFFTRGISHLCAPGFFFLLGYGIYHKHKKTNKRLPFILRGLFLVALQFTIVNYIWDIEPIYIGVIFALGATLILSGLLLPVLIKYGSFIGVLLLILTQYIATENAIEFLHMLFLPGSYGDFYILYNVVPWFAITAIGISIANKNFHFLHGIMLLTAFAFIRIIGLFGNINPYTGGIISFLNVTKYPPSLVFILLTMGINILIISLLTYLPEKINRFLITYGRSALVFYVLHLYLYSFMGKFLNFQGYWSLYIGWIIGVLLLYYPVKYFNKNDLKAKLKR